MKNKQLNQETTWLLREKYQGVESEAFLADCARLVTGAPLAYLIGHTPFLNCTIHLDSHPLIPRPETEYWVEQAIAAIKSQGTRFNLVLDLCAGSGAIGVAVARAVPETNVTFAELDPAHLPTIEKNLQFNTAVNRDITDSVQYKIIESDLFSALVKNTNQDSTIAVNRDSRIKEVKFDFILTNPPYIDAGAHTVDSNVVEHEPHLALFGGVAGMELIARIINETPAHLSPTGQLWIEHEPAQVEAIALLANQNNFKVITHPDQYGVPRFSVLTMAQ